MLEDPLKVKNPIDQLKAWYLEAQKAETPYPNAMIISTVGQNLEPASRVVLAKEFTSIGLVFYTSYQSKKGREIEANPKVSATFFWDKIYKQINLKGIATKTSRQKSTEYWDSRPRSSQISQYISKQSKPAISREIMDKLYTDCEKEFEGKAVPCPDSWGGYEVAIQEIEFWIGHLNRFHDRFRYTLSTNNSWLAERLYP